jgi:cell division protein FtsB
LTIVLAAILISYLNPLLGFISSYRESSAAKERLHELLAENRQLHARVQASDEPAVVERYARRQGMIEPGERPYVVHGLNR